MDNQTQEQIPTVQTPPPIIIPPVEIQQPLIQTTPIVPPPPEKNTKMLYSFLAVLIVIGIGALSIFFFINRQTEPKVTVEAPLIQTAPSQVPSPTITIEVTKTPEQELEEVTIVDPTADITDINTDINQL